MLDDVSITHLNFGKEYTAAIEAKQVAQQEAERAKFLVEKVYIIKGLFLLFLFLLFLFLCCFCFYCCWY